MAHHRNKDLLKYNGAATLVDITPGNDNDKKTKNLLKLQENKKLN